jgi:hypothetical protein
VREAPDKSLCRERGMSRQLSGRNKMIMNLQAVLTRPQRNQPPQVTLTAVRRVTHLRQQQNSTLDARVIELWEVCGS